VAALERGLDLRPAVVHVVPPRDHPVEEQQDGEGGDYDHRDQDD
jgi:hypothetical protein